MADSEGVAMQAGKLRHRIILQRPVTSTDELGQPITTFEDVLPPVFASVVPNASAEARTKRLDGVSVSFMINMRYRTDIDHDWRIKFERWTLSIVGIPVNVKGQNRELEVLAQWQST